jgi:hypothetical protein
MPAIAPRKATAQKYPTQPINVVAATSPGGGIDFFARVVAQKLSDSGMRAIVVNKPGANGTIGFEFVAKSPPDGYTLLMTAGSFVTTPMLYDKVPYDGERDFTPVIDSGYIPLILVTPPSFPPKTVKELIALAKGASRPGAIWQRRHRFGRQPGCRVAQVHDQDRYRRHSVQGQRAGADRADGRPRIHDVRHPEYLAALRAGQAPESAGGDDGRSARRRCPSIRR